MMFDQLKYPNVKAWLSNQPTFHASVALNSLVHIEFFHKMLEAIKSRNSQAYAPDVSTRQWLNFYDSDEMRLQTIADANRKYVSGDTMKYFSKDAIAQKSDLYHRIQAAKEQLPDCQEINRENSPVLANEIVKACVEMAKSTISLNAEMNKATIELLNGSMAKSEENYSQEDYFILTVFYPSLILYSTPPMKLLKKAQVGDLLALENLLLIDSSVIFEPTISERIHSDKAHNPERASRLLGLTTKTPRIQELSKKAKYIVAGEILASTDMQSAILGISKLTGPDILSLFDAYAIDKHELEQDPDFADVQPGSFSKTAREHAKDWIAALSPGNLF